MEKMEDKAKKKNVKKLIVYAVLLVLIESLWGPDRFRQRNWGRYLRSMQLQSVNYCF